MLMGGRLVPGCVFVFLLSFFLVASSIGGTVLTTKGFTFAGSLGATDTEIVQFPVPGPGKVILEASNTGTPLDKLGLIARAPKPPGQSPVDTRWDGPTPLRVEFSVTEQDMANLGTKGNVWTVFITLRDLSPPRGTGGRYAIPGLAVVGKLTVSFVASAPGQKTSLQPKVVPYLGGAAQPTKAVAQPAGTMSPAANIVGQPSSDSRRQGIPIQKEIMGSAAAPQKKFSPQSLPLPVTLEMTGMKFHPQSIRLPVTLEMTGMKFRPKSINLPATLEMTGMNTKREVFEKPPIKMLPSLLEKRKLP